MQFERIKVFISYSRSNIDLARLFVEELKQSNYDVWIDWESIPPSTEWLNEIREAIEETDIFLFLLSNKSAKSEICLTEITHANKNKKRVIPVALPGLLIEEVPKEIQKYNFLFLEDQTKNQISILCKEIVKTINTDFYLIKQHTRLQSKALEWINKGEDKSFLLRGKELQNAESWQSKVSEHELPITAEQALLIYKSRRIINKQIRSGVIIGLVILFGVMLLSVFAFAQKNLAENESFLRATAESIAVEEKVEAEKQALITESRYLANASSNLLDDNLPLSLLLAKESYDIYPTSAAIDSLAMAIEINPEIIHNSQVHVNNVNDIAYNENLGVYVTVGDHTGVLWDAKSHEQIRLIDNSTITSVNFSQDGDYLATGHSDGTVYLFDTEENYKRIEIFFSEDKVQEVVFDLKKNLTILNQNGTIIKQNLNREIIYKKNLLDFEKDIIPPFDISNFGNLAAITKCLSLIDANCVEQELLIFDIEKDEVLYRFELDEFDSIASLEFHPELPIIAIGLRNYSILIIDYLENEIVSILETDIQTEEFKFEPYAKPIIRFDPSGTVIGALFIIPTYEYMPSNTFSHKSFYSPLYLWELDKETIKIENLINERFNTFEILGKNSNVIVGGTRNVIVFDNNQKSNILLRADHRYEVQDVLEEWEEVSKSYDITLGKDFTLVRDQLNNLSYKLPFSVCEYKGEEQYLPDFSNQYLPYQCEPIAALDRENEILIISKANHQMFSDISSRSKFSILLIDLKTEDFPIISELIEVNNNPVSDISIHPNNYLFSTTTGYCEINIYAYDRNVPLRTIDLNFPSCKGTILDVFAEYSADGKFIFAFTNEGDYQIIDAQNFKKIGPILSIDRDVFSDQYFNSKNNILADLEPFSDSLEFFEFNLDTDEWGKFACELSGRNFEIYEWEKYFPERPYELSCNNFPPSYSQIMRMGLEAQLYANSNNVNDAKEFFNKISSEGVYDHESIWIGYLYSDLCFFGAKAGLSTSVEKFCEKSIQITNENIVVLLNHSIFEALRGNYKNAMDDLEKIKKILTEEGLGTSPFIDDSIEKLGKGVNPFTDDYLENISTSEPLVQPSSLWHSNEIY